MIRSAMWLALGLMMACTDPAFEGRIVELEAEVAALESEVAQLEQGPAKRAGPSNEQEEAAGVLAREIQAISQGQGEPARGKEACEELSKYPGTRGHGAMGRLCEEFAVVGAEAGELEVTQWYAGSADMNNGEATLLVFWELWCPHCRREVPKLQELHAQYAARGLNVIGLTQGSRGASDEDIGTFVSNNGLTYAIGKESGAMSERFSVRGVPAAAVVKSGKVVWRGHPARITDEMVQAWIAI